MEVIDSNETLLTDFEVKEILTYRNTQKDNQKDKKQFQNATIWITRSTLRYLGDKPSNNYTPEIDLNNFKDESGNKIILTKAEILMILNNCPTTEIVEDCDSRINDNQVQELLSIIKSNLVK